MIELLDEEPQPKPTIVQWLLTVLVGGSMTYLGRAMMLYNAEHASQHENILALFYLPGGLVGNLFVRRILKIWIALWSRHIIDLPLPLVLSVVPDTVNFCFYAFLTYRIIRWWRIRYASV